MTRAHPISTADRDTATLAARAGSRIAKAWRAYWQRRAQRATVELLHSLDDRTLRDIGVGRSEIPSRRLRPARRPHALLRRGLAALARGQVRSMGVRPGGSDPITPTRPNGPRAARRAPLPWP